MFVKPKTYGRPPIPADKIAEVKRLLLETELDEKEISERTGVGVWKVYEVKRYIPKQQITKAKAAKPKRKP